MQGVNRKLAQQLGEAAGNGNDDTGPASSRGYSERQIKPCVSASKTYVYPSIMFSLITTTIYFAANPNYALLMVFFQINSCLGRWVAAFYIS